MNNTERGVFLTEAHRLIEKHADRAAVGLCGQSDLAIDYPPNGGLSNEETEALGRLSEIDDPHLKSALRKVIADNSASVLFHLFNVIDGTGDPENYSGDWGCFTLRKVQDEDPPHQFLHDDFFDTYWDWKRARGQREWCLDNHDVE